MKKGFRHGSRLGSKHAIFIAGNTPRVDELPDLPSEFGLVSRKKNIQPTKQKAKQKSRTTSDLVQLQVPKIRTTTATSGFENASWHRNAPNTQRQKFGKARFTTTSTRSSLETMSPSTTAETTPNTVTTIPKVKVALRKRRQTGRKREVRSRLGKHREAYARLGQRRMQNLPEIPEQKSEDIHQLAWKLLKMMYPTLPKPSKGTTNKWPPTILPPSRAVEPETPPPMTGPAMMNPSTPLAQLPPTPEVTDISAPATPNGRLETIEMPVRGTIRVLDMVEAIQDEPTGYWSIGHRGKVLAISGTRVTVRWYHTGMAAWGDPGDMWFRPVMQSGDATPVERSPIRAQSSKQFVILESRHSTDSISTASELGSVAVSLETDPDVGDLPQPETPMVQRKSTWSPKGLKATTITWAK